MLYKDKLVILDLTSYEIGNVLWMEFKLGRIKDLDTVSHLFQQIINIITKEIIDNIKEVLKIAISKDLTFYDSSYIYVAERSNLTLVTEDKELLSKYTRAINTEKLLKELTKLKYNSTFTYS